jgi:hypothetical protein
LFDSPSLSYNVSSLIIVRTTAIGKEKLDCRCIRRGSPSFVCLANGKANLKEGNKSVPSLFCNSLLPLFTYSLAPPVPSFFSSEPNAKEKGLLASELSNKSISCDGVWISAYNETGAAWYFCEKSF